MHFTFLALVAVAACFVAADAHRRHHHGNSRYNNNVRRPQEGFYSWIRDLGNGRVVPENAYRRPGSSQVHAESSDDVLSTIDVTPSRSFYDFTGPVPIAVLEPFNGLCFYSNTTMNLNNTVAKLNSIDNTVVPNPLAVPLDGNAVPLTPAEIARLNLAYPALPDTCSDNQIIPAYPLGASPTPFQGPTGVIRVFSLDSTIDIIVPMSRINNRPQNEHSHRWDGRRRHHGHRHRG